MTTPQHIIRLQASNVKRLKAVEVHPEPEGLVIVGGRNAQGKSSLLDAIEMGIRGPRAAPSEPIARGETKLEILLETEDYTIQRTASASGWKLKALAKNGSDIPSPQALFDRMASDLTFDPLAFVRAKPRDQVDMVRELAGIDLDEMDRRRDEAYSHRTRVNQDVKRLTGVISSIELPAQMPVSVDTAEMEARLRQAQATNGQIASLEMGLTALKAKREALKAQISTLEAELAGVMESGKKLQHDHAQLSPVDERPLLDALTNIASDAKVLARAEQKRTAEGELLAAQQNSETLTEQIKVIDREKREALASANLPEGLEVTKDGLRLNGQPLEQASLAEKIGVSVALGVINDPAWRIMLVREGSSLDSEHMRLLHDLAIQRHAQFFVEVASDDGEGATVIIEDGMVKS